MNIRWMVLATWIAIASCETKVSAPAGNKKFVLSDSMRQLIAFDTVRLCNMGDELSLSGEIGFDENKIVRIYPRSSGQVVETKVSLGDAIRKGQTLAIIKSADVAGNYNDLESANADLTIAKRQLDNTQSLYNGGIASEKELTEAKQNYEKALSAKNKIQALININGGGKTSAAGEYVVTSPIDGYLVEKKISAGSFLRADMGESMFTVTDLKDVWVTAYVYEADIARVKEGYEARVVPVAYPEKEFVGKVNVVGHVLDSRSKAMQIRINLDNKELLLKPEMFARVYINSESGQQTICVASAAVLPSDGKQYVVLMDANKDVRVSEVEVLKTVGNKTFIKSGLKPGDVVITKHELLIFSQLTLE